MVGNFVIVLNLVVRWTQKSTSHIHTVRGKTRFSFNEVKTFICEVNKKIVSAIKPKFLRA